MEEKMARERIEPGGGMSQVEGKRELPSRRDFVKGGLVLAVTLAAARYSYPVARAFLENIASPAEGKETTLDVSKVQPPLEQDIGVSSEVDTAPEYIERMVEGEKITYWVSPGDTLEYISAMYETPVAQIIKENNLTSEELEQGQELIITTDIIHILQPGETFEGLAEKYGVSVPLLAATNGIFYTESFDFIKPGYQMTIPRSEKELTIKNIVSIRASDEWDKNTQEMINKMGEEIVYLLGRMRVFNGVEILDKGEIPVHPFSPEREAELKKTGDNRRGEYVSRALGEHLGIPWGIYLYREAVENDEEGWRSALAHEFGHNCNEAHVVAYVAGFRISQYQSWINKEKFAPEIEIKHYVVQPEDTFKGIAEKLGVSEALLGATNNLWFDENIELSPWIELVIPRREESLTLEDKISIRASNEWKNPVVQAEIYEAGKRLIKLLDQMRVFDGFEPIDKGGISVYPVPPQREAEMIERHEDGYFVSKSRSEITMEPWGIYIRRDLLEQVNEVWEPVIAHELGHNFEEKEGVSYLAGIGIIQYYSWILEQNPWER